jgi:pyruvate kinase
MHRRRTKIICSLEKSTLNAAAIRENSESIDGIRIVWNPGETQAVEKFLGEISNAGKTGHIVPVIIDVSTQTRGHIASVGERTELEYGSAVKFGTVKSGADIKVRTESWDGFFKADSMVYLGYGNVVLRVQSLKGDEATCEVVQGGSIFEGMSIHVPDTRPVESFKRVSPEVLEMIVRRKCEYVMIPGFDDLNDVEELRNYLKKHGNYSPWIILKIDSDKVYSRLQKFLPVVDGIMISRMEMALSIEPSMVPLLTKEIIQQANDAAKLVLTASEMLGSMRHNATPTRAEVSDIANAVSDGTDAVVISEEIANGPYLNRAIELMGKIIDDMEEKNVSNLNWQKHEPSIESEMDAVAYAAYKTAERTGAGAIVCITVGGNTALKLSSFRAPIPIVAVTFSEDTNGKLRLVRGVSTIVLDTAPKIDEVLPVVNDRLLRDSWLKAGDSIIFVSITISSVERENSNLFTVQKLK